MSANELKMADMSLRDWFAGMALSGLCAKDWQHCYKQDASPEDYAENAYCIADAMLAARQPQEQPDDDWIPWNGGECPVALRSMVEVRLRDGATGTDEAAALLWDNIGHGQDIIAYRIVKGGAK